MGTYGITAAYSGSGSFTASSDSTKNLFITRAVPFLTWANPAAISYGSALGSGQLNATASVPGTFVYSPPAGTVLSAGNNQTLAVTFTPADTTNYSGQTASVLINVTAPPPVTPPQLVVTRALSRDPNTNEVIVVATLANTGGGAATAVSLSTARIGSTATTTALPQAAGTIAAGTSAPITLRFPASVGTSGAASAVSLGGSYTGGSFISTARITLP